MSIRCKIKLIAFSLFLTVAGQGFSAEKLLWGNTDCRDAETDRMGLATLIENNHYQRLAYHERGETPSFNKLGNLNGTFEANVDWQLPAGVSYALLTLKLANELGAWENYAIAMFSNRKDCEMQRKYFEKLPLQYDEAISLRTCSEETSSIAGSNPGLAFSINVLILTAQTPSTKVPGVTNLGKLNSSMYPTIEACIALLK